MVDLGGGLSLMSKVPLSAYAQGPGGFLGGGRVLMGGVPLCTHFLRGYA